MRWFARAMMAVAVMGLVACASQTPRTDEGQVAVTKDGEQATAGEGQKVETAMSDSEQEKKPDRVCERYKRTGSHMVETICYSRSERERERDKEREEMRREVERSRAGDR